MNRSIQEEIIAVLWAILTVLLILAHSPIWIVVLCGLKCSFDMACAIACAYLETTRRRNETVEARQK